MMLMTADRPLLRGIGEMEAVGVTGLCFSHSSFTNDIIHLSLLSPQIVLGFAVFLWDNQLNPSS